MENDYAVNTVDICPVGALTSKDFRFQQRVWYLKKAESICTGCSTGCNIYVDYNEEGLWRFRPRFNENINGHWICDKGRGLYKNTDRRNRMGMALQGQKSGWQALKSNEALLEIKKRTQKETPSFVLTGQYTNEEYQSLLEYFPKSDFYHWINNEEFFKDFDGLLLRGDKNPNTRGLKTVFLKIKSFKNFEKNIKNIKLLFVLGPEHSGFYPDIQEKTKIFSQCEQLVWMSLVENKFLVPRQNHFQIPMKSFFEKEGSYTNYKGIKQKVKKTQTLSFQALSIQDCVQFFKEGDAIGEQEHPYFKQNQFLDNKEKVW